MKTMNINHKDQKVTSALGFTDEQTKFVTETMGKICKRTLKHAEYSKSNSLQDIITCVRIRTNENPEESMTEKELLLVYTGWQLGQIQNELNEIKAITTIAEAMKKMIECFTDNKKQNENEKE